MQSSYEDCIYEMKRNQIISDDENELQIRVPPKRTKKARMTVVESDTETEGETIYSDSDASEVSEEIDSNEMKDFIEEGGSEVESLPEFPSLGNRGMLEKIILTLSSTVAALINQDVDLGDQLPIEGVPGTDEAEGDDEDEDITREDDKNLTQHQMIQLVESRALMATWESSGKKLSHYARLHLLDTTPHNKFLILDQIRELQKVPTFYASHKAHTNLP
jgi:hypothetical protein